MNVIPQQTQIHKPLRDEYVQTVTVKGQVTIPVALRKLIGVEPNNQVLVSVAAGKVIIEPVAMSLEDAFGSVEPLNKPENFKELRDVAIDERVEGVLAKMSTK